MLFEASRVVFPEDIIRRNHCLELQCHLSGLRGLEVTFPPHDPSDAGSLPAEVVEFFRTEKFGNTVLRKGL
jgi:hypothetical protein